MRRVSDDLWRSSDVAPRTVAADAARP